MPLRLRNHRALPPTMTALIAVILLCGALGSGLLYKSQSAVNPNASASVDYPADINSNGVVDISDLSYLLSKWNTNDSLSDVNHDGTVSISDVSFLLSRWGSVGGGIAGPQAMKMISLGKPAYASAGVAGNANDTDYTSAWEPGNSGWLAYDLSSETAANRQSVVVAWYTSLDDGHSVAAYQGACPAWSGRQYLQDYTIQVNSAAGGGSAPATGWQTVKSISANTSLSGQFLINLSGYNWVRINGSGPNGISVNMDVADASNGVSDGWLFLGDSITTGYAGHFTDLDPDGVSVKSFTNQISDATAAKYRPIQENAAMACTRASDALTWIDGFLDAFPGKYVTLNFGTNDGWGGSGDPSTYYSNMLALVNKIEARGKIAVVATIPWPNNGGAWESNTVAMNAKILELYANKPSVVRGPDLYSLTVNKPNLYQGAGNVHFNVAGGALARKAWAQAAISNIYNKSTPSKSPGIYVSGNKLVNGVGDTVTLHGVNKMGSEYACIDGWGFFDGPTDQASINAMKTWNINAVRVTMNSVCWNNGPTNQFTSYNAAYAGTNYKNAIKNYVDLLVQNGIHPILDLQWAGCGPSSTGCYANWIKEMPDRPGAVNFWSDVAATFKDNKAVLFDMYNEPQNPGWDCWKNGGCTAYSGASYQYTMAGMQEMVSAVRSAGATTQPILLGGLQYSNDMSGWLTNLPSDPNNSLVASIHLYNFNWPCPTNESGSGTGSAAQAITCFTSGFNDISAIKASHPVVFGELGENDCQTGFVNPMLNWMLTNNYSMLGWGWNTFDCASNPSLISNYDGTPTTFGGAFKSFYTTKYTTWGGIK